MIDEIQRANHCNNTTCHHLTDVQILGRNCDQNNILHVGVKVVRHSIDVNFEEAHEDAADTIVKIATRQRGALFHDFRSVGVRLVINQIEQIVVAGPTGRDSKLKGQESLNEEYNGYPPNSDQDEIMDCLADLLVGNQ